MFYNFNFACKAGEVKKALKAITQFQIVEMQMNHDCKLSPDDGCEVCEEIWKLKTYLNKQAI
jgi:hypothetical protein